MEKVFLSSTMNYFFSSFRGKDLHFFLVELEDYLLEYRNTLGLNEELFGIELEYEKVEKVLIDQFIREHFLSNWNSTTDSSLHVGGEIISPVMQDRKKFWEELKMIVEFLYSKGAVTEVNAGGHIHVSAAILGRNISAWRIFYKLIILYEHVLYRSMFGDKFTGRSRIGTFAPSISSKLYLDLKSIEQFSSFLAFYSYMQSYPRYSSINFKNVFTCPNNRKGKNTIEFRMPNMSTNEVILQNNINIAVKMVKACRIGVINEDFLNYKLSHQYNKDQKVSCLCNTVCIKDALEFSDLIFDNNLDKVYFLRQYFKDFQETYNSGKALFSKSFVKK